jgi:prophage DNA circulation protein
MDGELAQDMGMNARSIPLVIYFDGPDNDKWGQTFERALFQRGIWTVNHPVDGILKLQLVTYKRGVNPTESGNVTEFTLDMMEPIDESDAISTEDPVARVNAEVAALNAAAYASMAAGVVQETASQAQGIASKVKQSMSAITGAVKQVNARINAIENQINELTTGTYMDVAALSGAVIQLVESPGLMAGNIASKVSSFATLGRRIVADLGNAATFSTAQINGVVTGELFLRSITAGMALSAISELPETRPEALSVLSQYLAFTRDVQAALDAAAKKTEGNSFSGQYFPGSTGEVANLNSAVIRYLLGSIFDLKIEKVIVLDRPRAPIEIAITEYKAEAGNADYYFDFLIRTNGLSGREILLLDTGREVKIYA